MAQRKSVLQKYKIWVILIVILSFGGGLILVSRAILPILRFPQNSIDQNGLKPNDPLEISKVGVSTPSSTNYWGKNWSGLKVNSTWIQAATNQVNYIGTLESNQFTPLYLLPTTASVIIPFDSKHIIYADIGNSDKQPELIGIDGDQVYSLHKLPFGSKHTSAVFDNTTKSVFTIVINDEDIQKLIQLAPGKDELLLATLPSHPYKLRSYNAAEQKILLEYTSNSLRKCENLDLVTKQYAEVRCPDGTYSTYAWEIRPPVPAQLNDPQFANQIVQKFANGENVFRQSDAGKPFIFLKQIGSNLLHVNIRLAEDTANKLLLPELDKLDIFNLITQQIDAELDNLPQVDILDLQLTSTSQVIMKAQQTGLQVLYIHDSAENVWKNITPALCAEGCTFAFVTN